MAKSLRLSEYAPASCALLALGFLLAGAFAQAASPGGNPTERLVFQEKLPNAPGKSLTAVTVSFPPGGKAGVHHHGGSVFAFVISGTVRSENSATGPTRVYKAGESFFEPPDSVHLITENASTSEEASLLAVFIAADDAKLTEPGK